MPAIYLSTVAAGGKPAAALAPLAADCGADGIELASSFPLDYDGTVALRRAIPAKTGLLLHNYFPRPREEFVLNLGALSPELLGKSRELCRRAVDLAAEIGCPFYSVHSGFAFNASPTDLGRGLTHLQKWPLPQVKNMFIESLRELCGYARRKNVRVLIENNVLAPFNLVDGINELLLGVTEQDLSEIFSAVKMDNLGLLLDMGHLKVSAGTLGFSAERFISALTPHIEAAHLSDNDGLKDINMAFGSSAWFLPVLPRLNLKHLVIEVNPAPLGALKEMVCLLRGATARKAKV